MIEKSLFDANLVGILATKTFRSYQLSRHNHIVKYCSHLISQLQLAYVSHCRASPVWLRSSGEQIIQKPNYFGRCEVRNRRRNQRLVCASRYTGFFVFFLFLLVFFFLFFFHIFIPLLTTNYSVIIRCQ